MEREDNAKIFLKAFCESVRLDDPLPLKPEPFLSDDHELLGQVRTTALLYLKYKNCPEALGCYIANEVAKEVFQSDLTEITTPNKLYEPLKLMYFVTSKVNKKCIELHSKPHNIFECKDRFFVPASCHEVKNSRRKMEDKHIVIDDLNSLFGIQALHPTSYYAVFDGHASLNAATYSAMQLHANLALSNHYLTNLPCALEEAFLETDKRFLKKNASGGTTALVAVLRNCMLYIAWVGDSQAILVRKGVATQLVDPHNPSRADERERIEKEGGVVMLWGTWRVNGQLAVSRAIGDKDYKPYVSAKPEINQYALNGEEECLILACDGLWDSVDAETAVDVVKKHLLGNPDDYVGVSKSLVREAKKRGSGDNISVVTVFFPNITLLNSKTAGMENPSEITTNLLVENPAGDHYHLNGCLNTNLKEKETIHNKNENMKSRNLMDCHVDLMSNGSVNGHTMDSTVDGQPQLSEQESSGDGLSPTQEEVSKILSDIDNIKDIGSEEEGVEDSDEEWKFVPGNQEKNLSKRENIILSSENMSESQPGVNFDPLSVHYEPITPDTSIGLNTSAIDPEKSFHPPAIESVIDSLTTSLKNGESCTLPPLNLSSETSHDSILDNNIEGNKSPDMFSPIKKNEVVEVTGHGLVGRDLFSSGLDELVMKSEVMESGNVENGFEASQNTPSALSPHDRKVSSNERADESKAPNNFAPASSAQLYDFNTCDEKLDSCDPNLKLSNQVPLNGSVVTGNSDAILRQANDSSQSLNSKVVPQAIDDGTITCGTAKSTIEGISTGAEVQGCEILSNIGSSIEKDKSSPSSESLLSQSCKDNIPNNQTGPRKEMAETKPLHEVPVGTPVNDIGYHTNQLDLITKTSDASPKLKASEANHDLVPTIEDQNTAVVYKTNEDGKPKEPMKEIEKSLGDPKGCIGISQGDAAKVLPECSISPNLPNKTELGEVKVVVKDETATANDGQLLTRKLEADAALSDLILSSLKEEAKPKTANASPKASQIEPDLVKSQTQDFTLYSGMPVEEEVITAKAGVFLGKDAGSNSKKASTPETNFNIIDDIGDIIGEDGVQAMPSLIGVGNDSSSVSNEGIYHVKDDFVSETTVVSQMPEASKPSTSPKTVPKTGETQKSLVSKGVPSTKHDSKPETGSKGNKIEPNKPTSAKAKADATKASTTLVSSKTSSKTSLKSDAKSNVPKTDAKCSEGKIKAPLSKPSSRASLDGKTSSAKPSNVKLTKTRSSVDAASQDKDSATSRPSTANKAPMKPAVDKTSKPIGASRPATRPSTLSTSSRLTSSKTTASRLQTSPTTKVSSTETTKTEVKGNMTKTTITRRVTSTSKITSTDSKGPARTSPRPSSSTKTSPTKDSIPARHRPESKLSPNVKPAISRPNQSKSTIDARPPWNMSRASKKSKDDLNAELKSERTKLLNHTNSSHVKTKVGEAAKKKSTKETGDNQILKSGHSKITNKPTSNANDDKLSSVPVENKTTGGITSCVEAPDNMPAQNGDTISQTIPHSIVETFSEEMKINPSDDVVKVNDV